MAGAGPSPPADDAPHLLVVDDDRRIRDLLSRFLYERGLSRHHRRQRRGRARQARRACSSICSILDVMMPGETGFDLAKSHPPDLERCRS